MRLRVRALAPILLLITATMVGIGEADVNQPSDGGGGTGGGGTPPPTAPPDNMCYLASGAGTSIDLDSLGTGFTRAILNWTLAPGNSYRSQVRIVAQGADGRITYDSGWDDMTPDDTYLSGGQSGYATESFADTLDYSGGLTFTDEFTNMEGQTTYADGMLYPPDPVTNTC